MGKLWQEHKKTVIALAIIFIIAGAALGFALSGGGAKPPPAPPAPAPPVRKATSTRIVGRDLFGGDYKNMNTPKDTDCMAACLADPQCKAWSWLLPRADAGPDAAGYCFLKDKPPFIAKTDPNIYSGEITR